MSVYIYCLLKRKEGIQTKREYHSMACRHKIYGQVMITRLLFIKNQKMCVIAKLKIHLKSIKKQSSKFKIKRLSFLSYPHSNSRKILLSIKIIIQIA